MFQPDIIIMMIFLIKIPMILDIKYIDKLHNRFVYNCTLLSEQVSGIFVYNA